MKHLTLILLAVATLLTAACDDSEKLENRIDFSSPYAIEDSDDPIQHRSGIVHENVTELIGEGRTFGLARSSSP